MGSCLSSTIIYSGSGIGKTGQVGGFAKMVRRRTGKRVRLFNAEPGGIDTISHLLYGPDNLDGLVEVWDLSPRPNFFEAVEYAARGWWPADVNNPESPLVAPSAATFDEIGGHVYEGLTAYSDCGLEELRRLGASNGITGAEKPPQQFTSGKLRIAGANQTYYGIVQGRIKKAVDDSQRVPVHLLWTARELKATDGDTRQIVFGPQMAGSAKTPDIPAWFGNCIHLDMRLEGPAGAPARRPVRRAYFKNHFVEDIDKNVPFLAKLRIPPEVSDQMEESVILTPDLLTMTWLFDKMDALRAKARELNVKQNG